MMKNNPDAIQGRVKQFTLNQNTAWLLLLSQVFNLSMVTRELSFWMLALMVLCLTWRVQFIRQAKGKPQRLVIFLLAMTGCIAIVISGKQLGVLLAMLHLLCFAYGLKTLELNSRKDFYQLILLGLFILATSLIFNQSLLFSSGVALIVLFNFSLLLYYFSCSAGLPQTLTRCATMLLQSVPLAIVLFVVFPRIAPFWQVPLADSAKTGLSDNVTPGDIANLARSNELAFRVSFDGAKPDYSQLYWRALVLEHYNGKSWLAANAKNSQPYIPQVSGSAVRYQVIAQPSFRHWLFALDIAVVAGETKAQRQITAQSDFTLQSKKIISQPLSYHVQSFLQAPLDLRLAREVKQRNLRYPAGSNPRLEQEALRLRQLYADNKDLVQAVLSRFRQEEYFYTLKPPLLINNSLEQFYFDTKSGFCVHYASAFTYLMRAAGIPARMVTGYMGGEYNPQGDYYAIYQFEAHAWTEIWLQGVGWQRVDPTAAVAPARVERGFSEQLLNEQSDLNLYQYKHLPLWNALRLQLAAIDYQWTRWVIGYSSQQQMDLLSHWFGKIEAWKTGALIGIAFFTVICLLWLQGKRKVAIKAQSPWLKLYQQALALLTAQGVAKPKAMPVNDFAVTVKQNLPHISFSFTEFSHCFVQLEYQNLSQQEKKRCLDKMRILLKAIKKESKGGQVAFLKFWSKEKEKEKE